jgi:DNA polymerase
MQLMFLDAETRAHVNLKTAGTDPYVRDCSAIIWTYTFNNEPEIGCWDILSGEPPPPRFVAGLKNDKVLKIAHKASFDRGVLLHSRNCRMAIPLASWRCTMAQAYSVGLPGSLDYLGTVLRIPEADRKLDELGKRGIQLFCIPRKDGGFNDHRSHPAEWAEFKRYARVDTAGLRQIYRRLPRHNYQTSNLDWWHLDQLVNNRGFGYDTALAEASMDLLARAKRRNDQTVDECTNGAVSAATQRGKLLAYLNEHYGAGLENLRASTIRDMLDGDSLEPGLRLLLEIRLDAAKASGAKYRKGLQLLGPQKRIRHAHQYCGAGRTGRDSHKGFQPGNMMRQTLDAEYIDDIIIPAIKFTPQDVLDFPELYGSPNMACANALRGCIVAASPGPSNPEGNELYDADYSNIESKVLAWLANEPEELAAYYSGADTYRMLWADFFRMAVADVTKQMRQAAKVVKLAFGFGGGVGALVTMSAGYNIDLSALVPLVLPYADAKQYAKAERAWRRAVLEGTDWALTKEIYVTCDILKQKFRTSLKATNDVRLAVDKAVRSAVRTPGTSHFAARCTIWSDRNALIIQLPDGSRLYYWSPVLHTTEYVDPTDPHKVVQYREHLTFHTARGKGWRLEKAWAGLFLENIVQAVANRILRDGARAVHADTLTVPAIAAYLATLPPEERTAIVLRIHDALTLDVPRGSYSVERLLQCMCNASPWAAGCPITGEGWHNVRYGKREKE